MLVENTHGKTGFGNFNGVFWPFLAILGLTTAGSEIIFVRLLKPIPASHRLFGYWDIVSVTAYETARAPKRKCLFASACHDAFSAAISSLKCTETSSSITNKTIFLVYLNEPTKPSNLLVGLGSNAVFSRCFHLLFAEITRRTWTDRRRRHGAQSVWFWGVNSPRTSKTVATVVAYGYGMAAKLYEILRVFTIFYMVPDMILLV